MSVFHNMSVENWDHDINLNLRSSFLFTQQLLSSLKNAAKSPCKYNGNIYDASVINVSSVASTDPTLHEIAMVYSVAKAGLDQLTRLNAHELGKYKIRVNGLKLGSVRTGIMEAAGLSKEEVDETYNVAAKAMILNEIGSLDDVSEMVKFLAMKNKSGWMTGANIDLNGGWLHGGGTTGVWSKM